MGDFGDFLRDLSSSSGIPFNLVDNNGKILYDCGLKFKNSEIMEFSVGIQDFKAVATISKKHETCINLLKYVITEEYKQINLEHENVLKDILEGNEVALDKIKSNFPLLDKGYVLFYISVEGSRYEAVDIINQLYNNDVFVSVYGDNIIIIGEFEDIDEHAKSIRDSIVSDLYCDCFVSYGNLIYDVMGIKKAYNAARESKILVEKFRMKEDILNYEDILFEKIVYNINSDLKNSIHSIFKNNFDKFDSEIIQTIEKFVNCDLNISITAKKLYIHRNTLIYRLDKIKKETGFDIRNFKEATVFIIAFLIWKEMK
ncbi:PucR family transcriptional regulator [Clostridium sediminicola]|uniref:PucR family transcriptional regulator n=1 Tax=Clostridium sediminicola TaxID=3114879 RepID=UPI0031F25154